MEDNRNLETQEEEQRTFTQEEVDEIVRKRLARKRKKAETEEGSLEPDSDRVKDLDARELRITAREKLQAAGMPMDLADVLRYSDEKSLEKAMEVIKNLEQKPRGSWAQRMSYGGASKPDPIREAMGLNRK